MLLSPLQTRSLFAHATENEYAILAVNADSPAAVFDCLEAARQAESPIIIETSLWQLMGRSFGAGDPLFGVDQYLATLRCLAESDRFQDVPVVYHTDHIKGPDTARILQHAIRSQASSVSLDSSDMDAAQNVAMMSGLCAFAHDKTLDVTLEMEAGVDDGITPLDEAKRLFGIVEQKWPGYLALWAPGVGTQHGLGNDLGGFSPEAVRQHRELASDLAERPIGIALHGSSGLTRKQLQEAVAAGVAKVNWSSESLLIRSQAAQNYYETNAPKFEKSHPSWKTTVMDNGVQESIARSYVPKVVEKIGVLRGAGKSPLFWQQGAGVRL